PASSSPKAWEGQQRAVARLVLGPEWQGPRRAIADPRKASEEPVDQCRTLMCDKVEGVVHQVAVQHRNGGSPGALDQMGESGDVGSLTLVQRQEPDGFDQCLGLSQ